MTVDQAAIVYIMGFFICFFIGMVYTFVTDNDEAILIGSLIGFIFPFIIIMSPIIALAWLIAQIIKKFKS